jgi:hypothetical protein
MLNLLRNKALRYRELACDIADDKAREEILRLAAEYEQRAELLSAPDADARASR